MLSRKYFPYIFLLTIFFLGSVPKKNSKIDSINPIIGNLSYLTKFGELPNVNTDEHLRIRTHLEYVESSLRKKDSSHLSIELQKNRSYCLDRLHDYWNAGIFPVNSKYEERRPCFIDENGRICAVGYLVEKTAGREEAERINHKFQYEELLNMNDPELENWILESGFTKEELATIQPMYDKHRHLLYPLGDTKRQIVFYVGKNQLYKNPYSFTSELSYEVFKSSRYGFNGGKSRDLYTGVGVRLDEFYSHGYSIGLRYFRTPLRYGGTFFNSIFAPYLGLSPVFFSLDNNNGFIIKPEAGFRFNIEKRIGLSVNISYGYGIPVINEKVFAYTSHELCARLGLSTNMQFIRNYIDNRKSRKRAEIRERIEKEWEEKRPQQTK